MKKKNEQISEIKWKKKTKTPDVFEVQLTLQEASQAPERALRDEAWPPPIVLLTPVGHDLGESVEPNYWVVRYFHLLIANHWICKCF